MRISVYGHLNIFIGDRTSRMRISVYGHPAGSAIRSAHAWTMYGSLSFAIKGPVYGHATTSFTYLSLSAFVN